MTAPLQARCKVHINRGTAVIARPGVGVQFNVLPHNAIVLPLPAHVSPGHVLTALAAARLPVPIDELTASLNYCGLGPDAAADIVDELMRCCVLREYPEQHSVPVLKSGTASDRQIAALRKEGISAHLVDSPATLVSQARTSVALLPGNMFLPADLHYMLMQAGISHLPSAAIDGSVIIGPLVIPGVTPCLNCFDGHYGHQDAQWNSIRMQAAGRPVTTDQLHVEASSLMVASIVARHLIPWQSRGCLPSEIPEILRHRSEIRLGDVHVSSTEITADPECMACQMTKQLPRPRSA